MSVSKFGALSTFLANFQDEQIRLRYTELTWELQKVVANARRSETADDDKLFEQADRLFGQ